MGWAWPAGLLRAAVVAPLLGLSSAAELAPSAAFPPPAAATSGESEASRELTTSHVEPSLSEENVPFSVREYMLPSGVLMFAVSGSVLVLRCNNQLKADNEVARGGHYVGEAQTDIFEAGRAACFAPEVLGAFEIRKTDTCVVCLQKPSQVGFIHNDLQHVVCCEPCARLVDVTSRRCPICNVAYKHMVRSKSESV